MATVLWFKPRQVELSTSNFFQGIGLPEFFDPARGRFLSQSQLAFMEPTTQGRPTVDPLNFRVQRPTEDPTSDPVYHLRVMLDRLTGMRFCEDNWDSYDSQPPSGRPLSIAVNLVCS